MEQEQQELIGIEEKKNHALTLTKLICACENRD